MAVKRKVESRINTALMFSRTLLLYNGEIVNDKTTNEGSALSKNGSKPLYPVYLSYMNQNIKKQY